MEKNVANAVEENVSNVENTENIQTETTDDIISQILTGQKALTELDDDQRDVLIHDFNEKNKGIAEMLVERADEDYQQLCKKEFEDYQSEYTKIEYDIADSTKAIEYAKWLKDWNKEHSCLPSSYWIGCLKFDEVITDIITELEKNKDDKLTFDYGALTYTHQLMMSPFGVGIEYARWMAENQDTYNEILNTLIEHIKMVECIKKKISMLQNRWALACSGFRVNILIKDLKDFEKIDLSNM